jgi:hypothetical protein
MRSGNAMDFLAVILLFVSECPKNRREDHPRPMNPCQCFVEADGAAGRSSLDTGRSNRKIGAVKYRSEVTAPRTICTVRSVLLVFGPPAPAEVMRVASRGAAVTGPASGGF